MKMEAEHRLEQLKKATDRIQKEIEEVTEREHELRNVGSIKTTSHETVDSKVRRMPQALASGKLKRTTSTPQILEAVSLTPSTPPLAPKMTNGVISSRTTPTPLRFATAPSQKGLMHRFLATRGKIYKPKTAANDTLAPLTAPTIALNPLSIKAFNRSLEIQLEPDDEPKKPPVRKGYVPVEEKIQKELHEMKERENELSLLHRRMPQALASGKLKTTTSTPQILEAVSLTPSTPPLAPKMTNGVISSRTTPTPLRFATAPSQKGLILHQVVSHPDEVNCNVYETSATNRHPTRLHPGSQVLLKEKTSRLMRSQMLAKSQPNLLDIGNDNDSDIYDGSSSLRSGTSTNTLNEDEVEKETKGKHKPNPRRRSTLIAQWENLIAAKKESNDNNNENDLNF